MGELQDGRDAALASVWSWVSWQVGRAKSFWLTPLPLLTALICGIALP